MNAELTEFDDAYDESNERVRYKNERGPESKRSASKSNAKRRNKTPAQINGIHRRRRKRISW
jgi:hypothetical protein